MGDQDGWGMAWSRQEVIHRAGDGQSGDDRQCLSVWASGSGDTVRIWAARGLEGEERVGEVHRMMHVVVHGWMVGVWRLI